ncbi:MAG TPA: LuxR C-terminal-related transcriptional regulator [Steroidobacter sp.]
MCGESHPLTIAPELEKRRSRSIMSSHAHLHCNSLDATPAPFVLVLDRDTQAIDELGRLLQAAGWRPTFVTCMEQMLEHESPIAGCALMDLDLARSRGPELRTLIKDKPELPIIFMSEEMNIEGTVEVMKAGAFDVLPKPLSVTQLLSTVSSAIETSQAELDSAQRARHLLDRYDSLSRRERQVLKLVVAGRINKQVGAELGISEITVKAHRGRVMRKMQARSLPDLVNIAASLQPEVRTSLSLQPAPSAMILKYPFVEAASASSGRAL